MYSINGNNADLPVTGHEEDRISGDCQVSKVRLLNGFDHCFGVWEVTPGEFRSHWPGFEAFTILSGRGTLEDGDGKVHDLVPGALVVIPPGSIGTWRVTETVRKTYVFPEGGAGRPGHGTGS